MQLSTCIPSTSCNYPYSTTFTRSMQTSIPKGSQDLWPTRKSHAAPAIMGCDAKHNLSRDAWPANQGLHAAPATPGCDVEPTDQCTYHPPHKSSYIPPHLWCSVPTHSTASSSTFTHHTQPATIQSLDDNVSLQSGNKKDVLRMLHSAINPEEQIKGSFPATIRGTPFRTRPTALLCPTSWLCQPSSQRYDPVQQCDQWFPTNHHHWQYSSLMKYGHMFPKYH